MSEPINIFDMLTDEDKRKQKEKQLFLEMCAKIKQLHQLGKTPQEIECIIKGLGLPLKIDLALMGNFSEIIRYGRPLTKRERKLFK